MNASHLNFVTLANEAETNAAKGKLGKYVFQNTEEKTTSEQDEQISDYLRDCRSNTATDLSVLNCLTEVVPVKNKNKNNNNNGTVATKPPKYWICDMTDNECYFLIITPRQSYLINHKLEVFKFKSNMFSYICVANRDPKAKFNFEITIIEGSFVQQNEQTTKESKRILFIIEDCIVYKGQLFNEIEWCKRTDKIKNIIARYRDIMRKDPKKNLQRYPFGFDSKDHFENRNANQLPTFWRGFSYHQQYGKYVYKHRKGANFTLGYIIRSDTHFPFYDNDNRGYKSIICWKYSPSFRCQIRLPLRNPNATNIDFYLRSSSYQIVRGLSASLVRTSMDKLRAIESLLCHNNINTINNMHGNNNNNRNSSNNEVKILVEITYDKVNNKTGLSGYRILRHIAQTECNVMVTSNELKYRKDANRYFHHSAGLHSLRDGDYRLLLTSTVEDAMNACTEMISNVSYQDLMWAFEYFINNNGNNSINTNSNNNSISSHNRQRSHSRSGSSAGIGGGGGGGSEYGKEYGTHMMGSNMSEYGPTRGSDRYSNEQQQPQQHEQHQMEDNGYPMATRSYSRDQSNTRYNPITNPGY